jgi:hypothetical protein
VELDAPAAMCLVAAVASLLRGERNIYNPEAPHLVTPEGGPPTMEQVGMLD